MEREKGEKEIRGERGEKKEEKGTKKDSKRKKELEKDIVGERDIGERKRQ